MPETIIEALGGPLDGETFDMSKCSKGGLLLRWSVFEDTYHEMLRRYAIPDDRGQNAAPYIWDGKRLSYERA